MRITRLMEQIGNWLGGTVGLRMNEQEVLRLEACGAQQSCEVHGRLELAILLGQWGCCVGKYNQCR